MAVLAVIVTAIVQILALAMFAAGIGTFIGLVKGSFLLRRLERGGRQDYGQVLLKSPMVPSVSTIATPPDASAQSLAFVRRLLEQHFGKNEVVVVLDGPSDADLEIWSTELKLCSSSRIVSEKLKTQPVRAVYESRDPVRVVVIDKEAGGTVDAWNAGVNASTSPVIGILDPASEFVQDVLLRMIQPMLESADDTVGVIAGVSAPCGDTAAAHLAALDSLRWWMLLGVSFSGRNMAMPFPGSAMLVRRKSILEGGGFTGGPVELFLRLHALALAVGKPYRVAFVPDPISYSRPVPTFLELRHQIEKQQQEVTAAFRKRVAIAGPFGWRALRGLYYARVIQPALELTALTLAGAGLIAGWVDLFTGLLVILSTIGMGVVVSMATVVFREFGDPNGPDETRMGALFLAAISENLVFRQKRNFWLLAGLRRPAVPKMENRGSAAQSAPPAVSAASNQ